MRPLTRHVRFGADSILYDPAALLLTIVDGRGGGWCVESPAAEARHWDGTSHVLGEPERLTTVLASMVRRWTT
jgi:hypothetical protein